MEDARRLIVGALRFNCGRCMAPSTALPHSNVGTGVSEWKLPQPPVIDQFCTSALYSNFHFGDVLRARMSVPGTLAFVVAAEQPMQECPAF